MPSAETMLIVALAGFALSATPGPSMLYVLSRSVGQSRAAGLASAIGLGIGGLVQENRLKALSITGTVLATLTLIVVTLIMILGIALG